MTIDDLLLQVVAIFRPHACIARPLQDELAHRFDIVKTYLRDNFSAVITLDQLAALVSLSPYHFLRKFKAEYHVSPQQMLMAIRLAQAKLMLGHGMPAAR